MDVSFSMLMCYNGASQVALMVRNFSVIAVDTSDMGSIPRLGRNPGVRNGNPLQYSCLENFMTLLRLQVHWNLTHPPIWLVLIGLCYIPNSHVILLKITRCPFPIPVLVIRILDFMTQTIKLWKCSKQNTGKIIFHGQRSLTGYSL